MANLQYRGAEVVQEEAMKKDHVASYRGTTYNTKDIISKSIQAIAGNYRGVNWKA